VWECHQIGRWTRVDIIQAIAAQEQRYV